MQSAPEPPETPTTSVTGEATVDLVLAGLDGLEQRSVPEHVAVFTSIDQELRAALDDPTAVPRPELPAHDSPKDGA